MTNSSSLPDSAVIAFNSDYELAKTVKKNSAKSTPERSFEEILNDMAEEIYKISYYLVDGSYKKKVIYKSLVQVFDSDEKMDLDNGAGVYLIVLPPSKSVSVLSNENKSKFRFGHLSVKIVNNPILKTSNEEEPVLNRLERLYEKLKEKS